MAYVIQDLGLTCADDTSNTDKRERQQFLRECCM